MTVLRNIENGARFFTTAKISRRNVQNLFFDLNN